MPEPERYEALVLGSGNGGMILAWHLAAAGRRTAVIERRYIGGSCHNINCLPTKNEIVVQTAMLAHLPYTGLRDAILTHPTMAEGLNGLFANVPAPHRG
jgi:2-polyprenyl-6-methoxyphenol hydroxylase-like FAD-dependent oxidoreductase